MNKLRKVIAQKYIGSSLTTAKQKKYIDFTIKIIECFSSSTHKSLLDVYNQDRSLINTMVSIYTDTLEKFSGLTPQGLKSGKEYQQARISVYESSIEGLESIKKNLEELEPFEEVEKINTLIQTCQEKKKVAFEVMRSHFPYERGLRSQSILIDRIMHYFIRRKISEQYPSHGCFNEIKKNREKINHVLLNEDLTNYYLEPSSSLEYKVVQLFIDELPILDGYKIETYKARYQQRARKKREQQLIHQKQNNNMT